MPRFTSSTSRNACAAAIAGSTCRCAVAAASAGSARRRMTRLPIASSATSRRWPSATTATAAMQKPIARPQAVDMLPVGSASV